MQNKLVKYAPFHSWFMILTRKLLKLDFLASVNLILMYRRVPRCTGNKGKAVPLNSKQAVKGDRGMAVPSGRATRNPLYRRLSGRIWKVRKISDQPGVQLPDRNAHTESLYRLRYPCLPTCQQDMVLLSRHLSSCNHAPG